MHKSTIDEAIRLCDANPEKVAELFRSYYNGKVTAEKLKNVSKSDLGALEWSIKQIPRLIKQGKVIMPDLEDALIIGANCLKIVLLGLFTVRQNQELVTNGKLF